MKRHSQANCTVLDTHILVHCSVTAPHENGSDILKQIASRLDYKPAVPHYAWPSKQVLAPVVEAKLPKDVASYEKDLDGFWQPLLSAFKDAQAAFKDKKGKSLRSSDPAFADFRGLRMPPPPPKFKVV